MEAIRQIVRIPEDHELKIKVPEYLEEDDLIEVILLVKKRDQAFAEKVTRMKQAAVDPLFWEDIKKIGNDFEASDSEGWE